MAADVISILHRALGPDEADSVALIAERANTSPRTIYRVLKPEWESLALDLADRLCIAAGGHLSECRIVSPDGTVE